MTGAEARHDSDELTRREFQKRAALFGAGVVLPVALPVAPAVALPTAPTVDTARGNASASRASKSSMKPSADTLDEALELLKNTGPEYHGGLANHGPMAAEALCALGQDGAVITWVKRYRERLSEPPKETRKIAPDEWKSALGAGARVGDWGAFMERELATQAWTDVLDTWVARLTPGLAAAAAHGLIRTAHATRALAARDNALRRHELAQGLAYWAAEYQELPVSNRKSMLHSNVRDALTRVETLAPDKRPSTGSITDGLRALDGMPSFAGVITFVDANAEPSAFLSELTEAFAHVYLANAQDSGRRVTFVHAVTGPSALRLIAPHVKPETTRGALRYAWQVAAALYAVFGNPRATEAAEATRPEPIDARALADLAVKSGDEHAIKMTEACLREHALNPKSVYLAAARDACSHLSF